VEGGVDPAVFALGDPAVTADPKARSAAIDDPTAAAAAGDAS